MARFSAAGSDEENEALREDGTRQKYVSEEEEDDDEVVDFSAVGPREDASVEDRKSRREEEEGVDDDEDDDDDGEPDPVSIAAMLYASPMVPCGRFACCVMSVAFRVM